MKNETSVQTVAAITDIPGNTFTTAVLTIGTPVSGDIATPTSTFTDEDWFKVELVAGQTYYFSLDGTGSNALSDAYLTLYQNFGNSPFLLFSDNNSGTGNNAYLTYTAATTATYYVAASGYAWTSGKYTLTSGVVPVDTIPDDQTTTSTLALGQSLDGLATGSDDHDWYKVTLTAGVTYDFTLAGKSVDGIAALDNGLISLMSYDADYLGTSYFRDGQDNLHLYFTATTTGTYYVDAASFTNGIHPSVHTNGGGYTVSYTTAPVDIDANGPVQLALGASKSSLISDQSDTDTYQIQLAAGQTISVYMEGDGADPAQSVSLQMGSQSDSADTYYGGVAHLLFTATTAGTYNIVAGGYHGTYTITTESVPADLAASAATKGVLAIGQTLHGYIETANDHDWYKLSLVAGQTYSFTMKDVFGDSLMSQISLLQANGTVLLTTELTSTSGLDANLVFTATTTGTYFLDASLASAWPNGDFSLSAKAIINDIGQTTDTSRAIATGEVVESALDFAGDKDWFAMSVVSGQTYSIDLLATGDNRISYIGLIMAAGEYDQVAYPNNGGVDNGEAHLRFTATETGTVYFSINNNYSQTGTYTVHTGLLDTISNWVDTSASLKLGQAVNGTIDYKADGSYGSENDSDWYAITLEAGKDYVFAAGASGNAPANVNIQLRDADGNPVYSTGGSGQQIQFHADQGGTYYIAVGPSDYQLGTYTVKAAQTTDIFDQSNTVTGLAIGGTLHSKIDTTTDQDWVKVTLVAGQSYYFAATPEGSTKLGEADLTLYNTNNNPVAMSTGGPGAHDAGLRFTATESGTYYLAASGHNGAIGNYALSAQVVVAQNPADAVKGSPLGSHTVSVFFAADGQDFGGHTATESWTSADIANFMAAAGTWSGVADVTFVQAADAASATVVVVMDSAAANLAASVPASGDQDIIIFNPGLAGNDFAAGGQLYEVFLGVTGFVLGLVSPNAWGPGHEPLEAAAQLDKFIYSVMSGGSSESPYWSYFGFDTGPMALDVAAIQAMYGAIAKNSGTTTYVLPQTGYSAIWDTGGIDTITVGDTGSGYIDLRPATLNSSAAGGGGYVSIASGAQGGFTIAKGVTIENATGGALNDTLYGNAANNILTGGAGDDVLWGGLGNDALVGGDGVDTADFSNAAVGVKINLGLSGAQNTGEGTDTLTSIEAFTGSSFADQLTATATTTRADGGGGSDTLILSGNYADYTLTQDVYQWHLTGQGSDLTFSNFETFKFADRTLTYGQLVGAYISLTGDLDVAVIKNGSVVITTADLDFNHDNHPAVSYTVTQTVNGTIYIDGVAGSTFTSAQLAGGHVRFMQNGTSSFSASFTVEARDSELNNALSNPVTVDVKVVSSGSLMGTEGNDTIAGTANAELILGNGGNDSLHATLGDMLYGGAGDDILYGNPHSGGLDGGEGIDTLSFASSTEAVQIDFVFGSLNDVYGVRNFENLTGSAFDDRVAGNSLDNIIDGGAGADRMGGAGGNDIYYVDNAGDVIDEQRYQGRDQVFASVSHKLEANVENISLTGTANINATGNNSNNILVGNSGINVLTGGAGNDTYYVNTIGDTVVELNGGGLDLVYASVSFALGSQFIENLTLTGSDNINATGNGLANVLIGNDGNNVLDGGTGADTLNGGLGNDTYVVDVIGDKIVDTGGTDTVRAALDYTLVSNLENLTLTGSAVQATGNSLANTLTGNSLNNTLIGLSGNDILDGGLGADVMLGGLGNDTYYVDNSGDVVTELNAGGTDKVNASVSYMLGSYIETLVLTGTSNLNGTGNGLANTLVGNAGNNSLNGLAGADIMSGGLGNDTYYVDNIGDVVTELNAGGTDKVNASVSYMLGSYIETLVLSGTSNLNGTGNNLANILVGNAGNNILNGMAGADAMSGGLGDDTYYVDAIGDVVTELSSQGTDRVLTNVNNYALAANVENLFLTGVANINGKGNALANTLIGNDGNNTLNGGAGIDTMNGGNGNDTYIVDNVGDIVMEGATGGNDTIYSSIGYSLGGRYVESLFLTGTANINAAGNSNANLLVGNDGNNIINGGLGADTMNGGLGNDIYYVDDAGDVVIEGATGGNDTIYSSISYSLGGRYVESLFLTGTANINAAGNSNANLLVGNDGNNIITGGLGADTMNGGKGNDTYYVDDAGDVVIEGSTGGNDTLYSTLSWSLSGTYVETLNLQGTANINATGNGNANTLRGNTGNNLINGAAGNDILTGGGGNDIFWFGAGSGVDTITDFSNDTINLNAYSHGVTNGAGIVIAQAGGNTTIDLGGGNIITLTGVTPTDLNGHIVW